MSPAVLVLGDARGQVADFLGALLIVYIILVIAYVLTQLFLSFQPLPTYNRVLVAVLDFLQQTVSPYLNVFRRFIPQIGPIDISPIVAIILLQLVGGAIVAIVRG